MVIIAYEGKSDRDFFNSLFEAYKLPSNEVIFYNFERTKTKTKKPI